MSEDATMLAYEISFHKHLCDSTGHEHRTEQGRVVVTDAPTREMAIEKAKVRFARSRRGLADWRGCADEIDVHPVGGAHVSGDQADASVTGPESETGIAARAYEIWEQEGRAEGHRHADWDQAVRECGANGKSAPHYARAVEDFVDAKEGTLRSSTSRR